MAVNNINLFILKTFIEVVSQLSEKPKECKSGCLLSTQRS